MSILSSTLGRLLPRYRTIRQWSEIYEEIIASRPVCAKTLANRRTFIQRIVEALGERSIGAVRPHEIARMVNVLAPVHPHTARRLLVESREMLGEAINYGWIDINPAESVKAPRIKIARRRLTLEQWQSIYGFAMRNSPPWVSRLLLLAIVTGQRRGDLLKTR